MKHYDFAMAGGGMAGLSLAYHLITGAFPNARILIVDREKKGDNDRTWCYWARDPGSFGSIAARTWSTIGFRSQFFSSDIDIEPYHYYLIRGADFYGHVLDALGRHPNVELIVADIADIDPELGRIVTDNGTFSSEWVFDSRFLPETFGTGPDRYHYLKQHFRGWEIETPEPAFDPEVPMMFDFRTPQQGQMRFLYVLPFSDTRALVEYTLFSASLLEENDYTAGIEGYLADVLDIHRYRVVGVERGIIPMTDEPRPRKSGARALTIGTKGGRVKASTGYAFRRTQSDSLAIVSSLNSHGHPFDIPSPPPRVNILDSILLQIMHRRGGLSESVFANLFRKNDIDRLFRFLDEEATLRETVALMATVPWLPFLGAWLRLLVTKRV